MTLPQIAVSIFGALLVVAGCGKKSPPSTATPASPAVASDSAAVEQAAPAPAGSPAPMVAPAQAAMPNSPPPQPIVVDPSANTTAVLGQLTQALRKYSFEHRRVPKTLSEVIGAGYVTTVPQPPPGKQFAVDVKKVEVVLVRQ